MRRIYHVAAVQGRLGVGYRPVENVGECVANAFARFDSEEEQEHGCSSILVPMLGTGVAHGPRARTAEELVTAAVRHLARETTRLERVLLHRPQPEGCRPARARVRGVRVAHPRAGVATAVHGRGLTRRSPAPHRIDTPPGAPLP